MPVEIKLLLFAPDDPDYPKLSRFCSFFHYAHHIEVTIKDLSSKKRAHINYASRPLHIWEEDKAVEINNRSAKETITLFSQRCFDEFVFEFYHSKFANAGNYNYAFNNCSDAVKFALDFFFPAQALNVFYATYQATCCWLYLGIHGVKHFPVPPGVNSPVDVMRRASLLSIAFGNPKVEESKPTILELKKTCAKKLANESEALYVAVENKQSQMINHLLDCHLDELSPQQLYYEFRSIAEDERDMYLARVFNRLTAKLIDRVIDDIIFYRYKCGLRLLFSQIAVLTPRQRGELLNYLVDTKDQDLEMVLPQIISYFSKTQLSIALMRTLKHVAPDLGIIKLLSTHPQGAQLDFEDEMRNTVLLVCVRQSHDAILTYFIDNFSSQFKLNQLLLMLLYVISLKQFKFYDSANLLCDLIFPKNRDSIAQIAERIINEHAQSFPFNQLGEILHHFIRSQQNDLAHALLKMKPGLGMYKTTDFEGGYAIHTVLRQRAPDRKLLEHLCESKVHTVFKLPDKQKHTAFSLAFAQRHIDAPQYLHQFVDQFTLDQIHQALLIAVQNGYTDLPRSLFKQYGQQFSFKQLGQVFTAALSVRHMDLAYLILEKNKEIGMYCDQEKNYGVHAAIAMQAGVNFISLLIKSGTRTQLQLRNNHGEDALELAVRLQQAPVVNFFIEQHARELTLEQLGFFFLLLIGMRDYGKAAQFLRKMPHFHESNATLNTFRQSILLWDEGEQSPKMVGAQGAIEIDWQTIGVSILDQCLLTLRPHQIDHLLLRYAEQGFDELIKLLFTRRPKVLNQYILNGNYAIHFLLKHDKVDLDVIKLFVEAGALFQEKFRNQDKVMAMAIKRNLTDVVAYFFEQYEYCFFSYEIDAAQKYLQTAQNPVVFHRISP